MILTFDTPHWLTRLHDELLAAGFAPAIVEGDGERVRLAFDGAVDEQTVRQVVGDHDPTPPDPPPDPDDELRAAIEGATSLNELKAALLGTNRPARVASRPT